MGGTLHIGADMVNGDVESLRQLLTHHTGSTRAAAELLNELAMALREGPVQHVVILPAKAHEEGPADAPRWRLRVTRAPVEVEL